MEYYSATEKNEILPFSSTWIDLEIVILSEGSEIEKEKYHMTFLICGNQNEMKQINLQNKTDSEILRKN